MSRSFRYDQDFLPRPRAAKPSRKFSHEEVTHMFDGLELAFDAWEAEAQNRAALNEINEAGQ